MSNNPCRQTFDKPGGARPPVLRFLILMMVGSVTQSPWSTSDWGAQTAWGAQAGRLSLEWVPRDTVALIAVRPARLLAHPHMATLVKALDEHGELVEGLGVSLANVEQASFVFLPGSSLGSPPRMAGIIVGTRHPDDAEQLARYASPQGAPRMFGGYRYHGGPRGPCSFFRGKVCVIADREQALQRLLAAGAAGASEAAWSRRWSDIAGGDVACLIDVAQMRAPLNGLLAGPPLGATLPLGALAPLWTKSQWVALSLRGDQDLQLIGQIDCASAAAAKSVAETATAILILVRNSLEQLLARHQLGEVTVVDALAQQAADLANGILANFRVTTAGARVELAGATSLAATAQFLALTLPAVQTARQAARRTQSINNLKQIALAFHNYYDTHKRFPTTMMLGPDGKTLHSWRVAILPYLAADLLYQEYRLDEPWDSDHNQRLLARMPSTYRHPSDPPDSTASSYYGLSGKTSVFGEQGLTFRKIVDGTSNTVLVVEAQRNIPWTKPQDIPFTPDKLPKLGGYQEEGFLAAFCDGSVRLIATSVGDEILKRYFQYNDGQPIPRR
ncbi:MAG: hypothetical protein CMJ59_21150 [Planctomycetaceae bacterium]|nr:hypothetical protein [Planctomycetaceae bacterium]